ncbi:MAG: carboxy terminal-processing peptidase [Oligosphaeraceae bacterium]
MRPLLSLLPLLLLWLFSWSGPLFAELDPVRLEEQFQRQVVQGDVSVRFTVTPAQQLVARAAVAGLLGYHFSSPQVTPALQEQWYENYFQMLDPGKAYFLQQDLREFRGYADKLYEGGQPNLEFAFLVYQRFLERLREWTMFAFQAYGREWDFHEDDEMMLYDSPAERQWAATREEREKNWIRSVKNALLADQLIQEEMSAREESRGDAEPEEEKEAGEQKAVYTPPPVRLRNRNALLDIFRMRREVEEGEVVTTFLNAFASLLDPHSCYYAPDDKEDFDIAMSLSLQGIGATLTWRDSYTVVMSLVPGGPAAKDGRLRPGDRIVAVAQSPAEEPRTVVGMPLDKVVRQIRGRKGTRVYLTVVPEGSSAETVISLVRDEIHLKDAEAQSSVWDVEGKRVLNIYLPSFYRDFNGYSQGSGDAASTTRDVRRLLREAQAQGPVDGLVLDLRNNGGGSLEEAIQLASLFLAPPPKSRPMPVPVVQTKNGRGKPQVRVAPVQENFYDGPLMVLVDRGAASATEILAACLQDTRRAVVVGDPGTHGKGTVQAVMDLGNSPVIKNNRNFLEGKAPGSLKVTIQKFYRVTGDSTQIRGVTPDIQFPSFLMAFKNSEGDLPHVLQWDKISPAASIPFQTSLRKHLPELQEFYRKYAEEDPAFLRYAKDVEEYVAFRRQKTLPLEISVRRVYRNKEMELARKFRHYQPERNAEERERLHDADEALYDDGAPREDVVLHAAMAIMGRMMAIDEREGGRAFSVRRTR